MLSVLVGAQLVALLDFIAFKGVLKRCYRKTTLGSFLKASVMKVWKDITRGGGVTGVVGRSEH